jgi:hypothetical protein
VVAFVDLPGPLLLFVPENLSSGVGEIVNHLQYVQGKQSCKMYYYPLWMSVPFIPNLNIKESVSWSVNSKVK